MRLYVGNLADTASDFALRKLFESCGKVMRLDLPTDRDTGRLRGFAFVEMPQAAARLAITTLDGHRFQGRRLRVSKARPRTKKRQHGSAFQARSPRDRRAVGRSTGKPPTRTVSAVYRSVMSSGRPLAAPEVRPVEVPAQRRRARGHDLQMPSEPWRAKPKRAKPRQAGTKLHLSKDGRLTSSPPIKKSRRHHGGQTEATVVSSSKKKRRKMSKKKARRREGQQPEEAARSVWTVSGGLPSLGRRR